MGIDHTKRLMSFRTQLFLSVPHESEGSKWGQHSATRVGEVKRQANIPQVMSSIPLPLVN